MIIKCLARKHKDPFLSMRVPVQTGHLGSGRRRNSQRRAMAAEERTIALIDMAAVAAATADAPARPENTVRIIVADAIRSEVRPQRPSSARSVYRIQRRSRMQRRMRPRPRLSPHHQQRPQSQQQRPMLSRT